MLSKLLTFFGQFHLKAEGKRILEHPGLTLWSKNLRKNRFCKLRQCCFTAPQKCTFCSISGHKTLSYHENFKTLFQMTTTIGMVRPRQFIEPGLGCQYILILALDFFQCSGQHMVPISCSSRNWSSEGSPEVNEPDEG